MVEPPMLHLPRQCHRFVFGETTSDGVLSSWNGHHLVDMGGQSLSTGSAMGRMFLTLMAGCAELERNLVAERTASVLAHKKQQGKVYNHTPFGFERVGDRLVAAVDEMAMVHLMQERREDGWSLAMIADAFNTDHIPGKNGGRWYGRTVKNILENSVYQTVAAVAGKEAA
jgi:DNA invertase Pin-like site-specific DNA recombinase